MRPVYDDFDDFDSYDFADSAVVKKMLREQAREELRLSSRRQHGPGGRRQSEGYDSFESDSIDDYEDYEEYEDYNDDEFDRHYGLNIDH